MERELPTSLFDVDPALQSRIHTIIYEENKKMQANDSDFQRFERLKREIEWNVD